MKRIILLLIAATPMTFSSNSFADDDPNMDLIKARQGEMELRAYYLGPLVAMAKGEIPYDAKTASANAASLKTLLTLDLSGAWAPGTDNNKYPGKTTALPEIWSTYPKIADHGKKYAEAVNAFADNAGKGLNQLRTKLGAVGDGCKGCHDDFVEKR